MKPGRIKVISEHVYDYVCQKELTYACTRVPCIQARLSASAIVIYMPDEFLLSA